ncbi:dTDP-4-dehydrorhamnose reductase [Patescibacteria group bacterium]|nr:dTDP-4-dehydrorhamnose reductase [Patescibacteria group bacterium]
MNIIITGAKGQLGYECTKILTGKKYKIFPYSDTELDITNSDACEKIILKIKPEYIINCAALTNVDYCEEKPNESFLVNTYGPINLACACLKLSKCKLIHISTNAVFDGLDRTQPYKEDEQPTPLTIGAYASSKLAGELAVRQMLGPQGLVIRTSWLYGKYGNKNFVSAILTLVGKKVPLEIVIDEISSPTSAKDLALGIFKFIEKDLDGNIYHLSNKGVASRYDFAKAIIDYSDIKNYPLKKSTLVKYLTKYPRPSIVPPYTPLENINAAKYGIELPHWKKSLKEYLKN